MPAPSAPKAKKAPPRDRSTLSPSEVAKLDRQAIRMRLRRLASGANRKRVPPGAHRARLASRRASAMLKERADKKASKRAKRGLPPTKSVVKATVSHATVLNIVGSKSLKITRHRHQNRQMTQDELQRYGSSQRLNQW